MKLKNLFFLAALALLVVACNNSKEKKAEESATDQTAQSETTAADNGEPQPGQMFDFGPKADYAGSHILIGHKDAQLPNNQIERTKEEALEIAKTLIAEINANPETFTEVAKTKSDGPSGQGGGYLGSWQKGKMVPEFDAAVATLEVGAITAEPVETQFGYHIIRRDAIPESLYYGLEGFIIAFKNPRMPNIEREALAAEQRAKEVSEKLTQDNFDQLAAEHNDLGDGVIFFGSFKADDMNIPPAFIDAAKTLRFGEAKGPVELPMGYAFMRRVEVERRAGSHILVTYKGSESSKPGITKTKEEAEAFAKELLAQVKANPETFGDLAKQHSDDGSAVRDGNLGEWWRGEMVPPFEAALNEIQKDEIYPELVESRFGYHIIRRNPTELERTAEPSAASAAAE